MAISNQPSVSHRKRVRTCVNMAAAASGVAAAGTLAVRPLHDNCLAVRTPLVDCKQSRNASIHRSDKHAIRQWRRWSGYADHSSTAAMGGESARLGSEAAWVALQRASQADSRSMGGSVGGREFESHCATPKVVWRVERRDEPDGAQVAASVSANLMSRG